MRKSEDRPASDGLVVQGPHLAAQNVDLVLTISSSRPVRKRANEDFGAMDQLNGCFFKRGNLHREVP